MRQMLWANPFLHHLRQQHGILAATKQKQDGPVQIRNKQQVRWSYKRPGHRPTVIDKAFSLKSQR